MCHGSGQLVDLVLPDREILHPCDFCDGTGVVPVNALDWRIDP